MGTYNTGNPVGSVDVKDLYDNAQNLDHLVNDRTVTEYPDRFAQPRKSWWGMEQDFYAFLQNSQFETPPLNYVDGAPLTVNRPTQTILRAGQLYRVNLPSAFPVNLTGTWATDQLLLSPMSDAVLRRDLANTASSSLGAALLGRGSQVVASIAALKTLLKTSASQFASVLGYYAAGDGGGGVYWLDVTDNTTADNGGTVIVASDGGRWKLRYSGLADPRIFGAKLDGTTDAAAAIVATHAAFGEVALPAGTLAVKSNMVFNATKLKIHGLGQGQSILLCTVASGSVIKHTPTTGDQPFDLQGFTMRAAAAPVTGQWAIWVDGSSQITGSTYNGKFQTGEREKHRGRIRQVTIEPAGNALVNGFANGIRVTALPNFSITGCVVIGRTGGTTGEAFAIDGDGVPVDIRLDDLYAYNYALGMNMPDYTEGVYMRACEFINVVSGIYCGRYQAGRSVLANQSLCGSSGNRIGPMHTASQTLGMDFRNAQFCQIRGNTIVMSPPASTANTIGINVDGGNIGNFSDNVVFCGAPANSTNIYALNCANITNSTINNNQGQGCYFGAYLGNSQGNTVTGNEAFLSSLAYGAGADGTSSLNYFGRNFGDHSSGQTLLLGTQNNSVETADYSAAANITVTAVASADVTVAVPAGVFKVLPQAAYLMARDGAKIIGSYKASGSSLTSLAFTVRNMDGTTMTAGSYVCSVFASLR